MTDSPSPPARALLDKGALGALLDALRRRGHDLIGPTLRDGAIMLDPIDGIDALPAGIGDDQAPGRYRLRAREDGARFGHTVGPASIKRELFVPSLRLFQIRRSASGLAIEIDPPPSRKIAFVGARACDLAAIAVLDRVLLGGPMVDTDYAARRKDLFVLAVHCAEPGGTCFCASQGTGPTATAGFDLALTELCGGAGPSPRYVVEVGTEAGAALLAEVHAPEASADDRALAEAQHAAAIAKMGRSLDTAGLRDLLARNLDHPRWEDIASRCLGCANCTLVCPTCFCSTVEDRTDLEGALAERVRRYDSCFTLDHAYIHGGSVRPSLAARYRQWLTHKLSSWFDQFGTSGCVGCGRCITFCPVGIDITAEAAAIRAADGKGARPST
ncbi:MAG: 4Fe-4S dicluster domain-containing protein [Byssovorax sp.]